MGVLKMATIEIIDRNTNVGHIYYFEVITQVAGIDVINILELIKNVKIKFCVGCGLRLTGLYCHIIEKLTEAELLNKDHRNLCCNCKSNIYGDLNDLDK